MILQAVPLDSLILKTNSIILQIWFKKFLE